MASQNRVESKLEPWFQLNNKIIMVTRASSGLGWKFSLNLAKAGYRIIVAARRVERLKSLCDHINEEFNKLSQDQPRAVALELDISTSEPIIKAHIKKAWYIFGRIDALINNAGMRDAKQGGSIINISSVAAINRGQFHGAHAYAASKSAVNSITKVNAGCTLSGVPIFSSL
ncbi:putative short chain-type dehydrogenase [Handroanthus impetiginosus]|uniref:Putative short chain-type dehydrogenase n=1 Tax=Handroanthus impetiginosus TaxID=429701 RepID=A0A2G9HQY6_9LAMI|nr:putative short chain-type dehydrogenase [Handroanthus impetiginosus]